MSISMTWPQYLRGECVVDGVVRNLPPKLGWILIVLMLRRGQAVSIDDLVEAVYPDPDAAPDGEQNCIAVGLTTMRRVHRIPIVTVGNRHWMIEKADARPALSGTPRNFGLGRRTVAISEPASAIWCDQYERRVHCGCASSFCKAA